jgi:hypothetical protein
MHDTSVSSVPFARVSAAITQRKLVHTTAGLTDGGLVATSVRAASSSLAGIP